MYIRGLERVCHFVYVDFLQRGVSKSVTLKTNLVPSILIRVLQNRCAVVTLEEIGRSRGRLFHFEVAFKEIEADCPCLLSIRQVRWDSDGIVVVHSDYRVRFRPCRDNRPMRGSPYLDLYGE